MCVLILVNALYNPDREGYLYKLSTGRVRGWKRRWVVLTEKVKRYLLVRFFKLYNRHYTTLKIQLIASQRALYR